MDVKQVEDCKVYECIVGSKAYGTDTPSSDTDLKGICIPKDKSYYFGIGVKKFEQKDKGWPKDQDKVIYDIRKAFSLMADANPNMLDMLYVREQDRIYCHKLWERVLDNRDKFLSKRARYSFTGYAFAQLKRIKTHRGYLLNPPSHKPTRKEFGLPERKLISEDHSNAFQWLLARILKDGLEWANLSEETKEELMGVNYIGAVQKGIPDDCWQDIKGITGASDQWIETIMREKKYINAMNNWNAYHRWKTSRNKDRAQMEEKFGFDLKHAVHLVRLMRMGIEILEHGKVIVYRPDREELLAIRNGAWSYEQVVECADQCECKIKQLYKTSKLPKKPDKVFLDKLCQDMVEEFLFT